MKQTFKRLRNKFLFFNLTLTMLIISIALISVYFITSHRIDQEDHTRLRSALSVLDEGMTIRENVDADMTYEITATTIVNPFISFRVVVDEAGSIQSQVSFVQRTEHFYELAVQLALSQSGSLITLDGKYLMHQMISYGDGTYGIDFIDVTDSQRTLRYLAITLISIGTISFVAIFLVSLYYANRSVGPISKMWDAQKRFVTHASHELKTPLSVIRANCEVLAANKEETIQSQEEWLGYMEYGVERMAGLINRLLVLDKAEDAEIPLQLAYFSVSSLMNQMCNSFKANALRKQVTLNMDIPKDIDMNSNQEAIGQVLEVLLENAVKYVNREGEIHVALSNDDQQIEILVENSGSGIEAKDLPLIFERFYRRASEINSEEEGFGLGLSMIKPLLEKLGGEIKVESEVGRFTRFIVIFPKK